MNEFIESLERLYLHGVLKIDDIEKLYNGNKITADQKDFILHSA